jgi:hypothetical protein
MGMAIKEKTSFNPYTLYTLFKINVWVDKCLDATLSGMEFNFIKCWLNKIGVYDNSRSYKYNWNMENHPGKQCNHSPHGSGLAN